MKKSHLRMHCLLHGRDSNRWRWQWLWNCIPENLLHTVLETNIRVKNSYQQRFCAARIFQRIENLAKTQLPKTHRLSQISRPLKTSRCLRIRLRNPKFSLATQRKKDKAHQDTVAIRETMNVSRLVIDHRHHRLRHRHLRSPLLPPLRERTISPSTTNQKPSQNPKTVITRKYLETLKPRVGWSCEGFNCFSSIILFIYCFLIIHNTKAFKNSGIELCWSWICWWWNTVLLLVLYPW